MSVVTRKVASATAVMLVAGLGAIGSPGAATADEDSVCTGMSAPANNRVLNRAPALVADTAKVLAGSSVAIKVLANDSDPDGDKLYVTSTSNPGRGETCIDASGVIEYLAAPSATSYTQVINYGVTDGDLYRTARITVSVEGLAPVRPVLKKRLLLKKGSKAVKRRAVVAFTNPNKRSVLLLAGDSKKKRPSLQRVLANGQSASLKTKAKRLTYITVLRAPDGEMTLVSLGILNTRNGGQFALIREAGRATPDQEALARRWLQK